MHTFPKICWCTETFEVFQKTASLYLQLNAMWCILTCMFPLVLFLTRANKKLGPVCGKIMAIAWAIEWLLIIIMEWLRPSKVGFSFTCYSSLSIPLDGFIPFLDRWSCALLQCDTVAIRTVEPDWNFTVRTHRDYDSKSCPTRGHILQEVQIEEEIGKLTYLNGSHFYTHSDLISIVFFNFPGGYKYCIRTL